MGQWPGRWHSKVEAESDDGGVSYTNDHGIRWLTGDGPDEWLQMYGDIPDNRC